MSSSITRAHTVVRHAPWYTSTSSCISYRLAMSSAIGRRRLSGSAWSDLSRAAVSASTSGSSSKTPSLGSTSTSAPTTITPIFPHSPPIAQNLSADAASPQTAARAPPVPTVEKPRPTLRARKAALTIMPEAVLRLKALMNGPIPQLIRIGVRNKGCAGLSYHLEYVEKAQRFDEVVEQDGVKVIIDSKALFSIIGSEMDWVEDSLSSKFAFNNPNIKDACGCGESFNVGA